MTEEIKTNYVVLTRFRDKETQEVHTPGENGEETIIELTEKRASEIIKKLGPAFITKQVIKEDEETPDETENNQEEETEQVDEPIDFEKMRVDELNEYAAKHAIEIPEEVRLKGDLIKFLKEATSPAAEE